MWKALIQQLVPMKRRHESWVALVALKQVEASLVRKRSSACHLLDGRCQHTKQGEESCPGTLGKLLGSHHSFAPRGRKPAEA